MSYMFIAGLAGKVGNGLANAGMFLIHFPLSF